MRRPVVALACAAAALACVAPPAVSQDRTLADPVSMARWARDLDTGDPARVADACERFEATGPEAIPVLIEVVRTRTDFAAAVACTLLATRGRDAVAAVPVIEEQIAKRDDRFLRMAARALWKLEARPVKSLPSLRALAKQQELAAAALVWRLTGEEEHLRSILERDAVSENLARRAMVVDVLAEFGPKAGKEFSFRLVLPLARDANAWVRAQSIGVLTAVDPAAPESLVEYELALAAGPQLVRFQAIRGLAKRGIDKPGVLAAFARSHTFSAGGAPDWVWGALQNGSGLSYEQLGKDLVPLLASDDLATRIGAALISSGLGPKTPEMARVLAGGLEAQEFRRTCLSALTTLGDKAAPVATEIAALLEDADYSTAKSAADLLLALGKPGAAAAPAVAAALEDSRPGVRQAAANLLLTVYGTPSVPDLEERLKGIDPAKNPEAARVLRKVRGLPDDTPSVAKRAAPSKESIEELVRELREAPVGDRRFVLQGIADVGPAAAAALPTIRAILDDPGDSSSRGDAMIALAAVAPADPTTAERIGPYLVGGDARLRLAAVKALVHLGKDQPRVAVGYLVDAMERDADLRLEAAMALARIGAASVDSLRGRVGHADAGVRLWAVRSLGEIGPSAKDAIPALEGATGDADAGVRDAAARALKKIRGN